MANRFVGPIKRGEIGSIEELKSRFKALAKETHPDLGGDGASALDFAALRSEYEAALGDFHRHRFGLSASLAGRSHSRGQTSPQADGLGGNPSYYAAAFSRPELYRRLREVRRGGFPKLPRHEKERLRYEYRRYLALALLDARGGEWRASLEAFEAAQLRGEAAGQAENQGTELGFSDRDLARGLGLLDSILAWHTSGLEPEKATIILEFGKLVLDLDGGGGAVMGGQAARRLGEGLGGHPLLGFLACLVEDLSEGASLA